MPDEQQQTQQAEKKNAGQRVVEWLDGRKTTIAAVSQTVLVWLLAKHILDDATATMIAGLLSAFTGLAIADKVRKGTL